MYKAALLALLALIIPLGASAAGPTSFSAGRSLLLATSTPGNAYITGAAVTLTAPVGGDLIASGGSVVIAGPVAGDAFVAGGSVSARSAVAGDMRAVGGSVHVDGPIAGDLVAFGASVEVANGAAHTLMLAGATVNVTDGSQGPVTIYGNTVNLGGTFMGDVHIYSSGKVTLAPNTVINGTMRYEAPEPATIPATAKLTGGAKYTNASYLPNAEASRALAVASITIFLIVKLVGALILAGLFAGLFPRFAQAVSARAHQATIRRVLLTALLGFAVVVATPVLMTLLALTFIGLGLAFFLFVGYIALIALGFLYAGILVGGVGARRFLHRETVRWHDGVFGMLALMIISLVPVIGPTIVSLLSLYTTGVLLQLFFRFAFPHEDETPALV